jgi:2-polyprenyl-6-hydroxyphenyl methylase/3-demethylubiquinone-9 3-methyltransferase
MPLPTTRPLASTPPSCKICGGTTALYGTVDFNKSCEEQRGMRLPPAGVPVHYYRCAACEFMFTDALDDWSAEEFRAHIYNDDYHAVDPDYRSHRPGENARMVANYWGELKRELRVLDFGGGNDAFCAALRGKGFATAVTYDPLAADYARRPEGKFDLVTCFETLEHLPDPAAGIATIVECAADPGLILYSTLLQPYDLATCGVAWWYVAPRNGHVSIFSQQALTAAWEKHGYKTVPVQPNMHFAFRKLPPYLAQLQTLADNYGRKEAAAA